MDFRKYKEEDVASKVRRARTWDVRMSTLPTSYARQARAARSLRDIGVPSRRPDQVMAGREQGVGHGPGTWHGPAVGREQDLGRGLSTSRELGAGCEQGVAHSPGVRLDVVA